MGIDGMGGFIKPAEGTHGAIAPAMHYESCIR